MLERNVRHGDSGDEATQGAMIVSLGAAPSGAAMRMRANRGTSAAPTAFAGVAALPEDRGILPAPPAPRFLGMDELDVAPEIRGDLNLAPPLLGTLPDSAHTVLVLFIDSTGQVETVELEASTLPATYVETTIAAFRSAAFKPGERAGRPVNSRIRIDISVE
jgi:hypothetical protein